MSTLLGLDVPEGQCGVIVPRAGALIPDDGRVLRNGEVVVLDNTFPHYVYNDAPVDRFVLMCECWHPALTPDERFAISTLFAVKDRFTCVQLRQCPWGYSEDELSRAIDAGDLKELGFWRSIAYGLDDGAHAMA